MKGSDSKSSVSAGVPQDFGFGEDHELLRDSVQRVLAERCPLQEVRRLQDDPLGYDPDLWKEMGKLGWLGLTLPEELGGAGLGHLHLALALEEMGRCLLPGPFFSTVLAATAILHGADREQRERWLPEIASGEKIAAITLCEPTGSWEPEAAEARAEAATGGFALHGVKTHVQDAASAALLVAPFREGNGETALFVVELPSRGIEIEDEVTLDRTRRTMRVRFDGARVPTQAKLAGDGLATLRSTFVCGYALLAAEMVGGAEATLEMTRLYAIERKQFGRSIGSFQAVKHPLVDTMVGVELARSQALAANAAWDQDRATAEPLARMAKALASDVYAFAVRKAVQFHGGFGFTIDCDAHLYFKRALASRATLGDATHHRRHLAETLLGA